MDQEELNKRNAHVVEALFFIPGVIAPADGWVNEENERGESRSGQ
jgi:hypothetical protein